MKKAAHKPRQAVAEKRVVDEPRNGHGAMQREGDFDEKEDARKSSVRASLGQLDAFRGSSASRRCQEGKGKVTTREVDLEAPMWRAVGPTAKKGPSGAPARADASRPRRAHPLAVQPHLPQGGSGVPEERRGGREQR